jgi:hypothetical protein
MEGDPLAGFGQCQDLKMVKSIARTPAQDTRLITPAIITYVSVERKGPNLADLPKAIRATNQHRLRWLDLFSPDARIWRPY